MTKLRMEGWHGAAFIAVTCVYFLIFAQFGFLARLAELGISGNTLKVVLAAMAAGGILFSLLVPRLAIVTSPILRLRIGFILCAVAALLSILPLGTFSATVVAFLIGASLGIVTVTLAAHVSHWAGTCNPLLSVGAGTGLGYFFCNIPAVFIASPEQQALIVSALCLVAIFLDEPVSPLQRTTPPAQLSFPRALLSFAALVWLDSAAFYIIQHTPALKAGTWMGNVHLWANGIIHLFAALLAALLLASRRASLVLACAFAALAFACLLLLHPALILSASLFYPLGVSLYSVALWAYPSFLSGATSDAERARQAGWIYAIAGWAGSAMGIGMGQNLGHVPPMFVFASGVAVLLPALHQLLQLRTREAILFCIALVAAYALDRLLPARIAAATTPVDRGRQVYISEGCIHCHSQYVRPGTRDTLLWGSAEDIRILHSQQPPLIGNRRQGPDLAEVGARRSPLWLKAHLINPAKVSGASIMPSYAFLFGDSRGEDLVAYLASLRGPGGTQPSPEQTTWDLSPEVLAQANPADGQRLYKKFCATCHEATGATRIQWQTSFRRLPTNLFTGPFTYLQASETTQARILHIAHIAKFGIPGTDMPGHEYLSDHGIASLSLWLAEHLPQPIPQSQSITSRSTP